MLFAPVCFAIMSIIVDKNARGIMFLSVIIFTLSYYGLLCWGTGSNYAGINEDCLLLDKKQQAAFIYMIGMSILQEE